LANVPDGGLDWYGVRVPPLVRPIEFSPEYGEEDRMTTVAAKPAAFSPSQDILYGLAAQAARVAEADRERTALLAAVGHDLRAPLAAAKAAVSGLRADDARLTTDARSFSSRSTTAHPSRSGAAVNSRTSLDPADV
jgi:K+-sensing histidine kinase KdpD